jgi:bacterioferritin
MKTTSPAIQALNSILRNELTAINQYFLHARILENWGVIHLAQHEYKESIEEMKHADALVKRILLLDGLPNLQDLNKLMIGENVEEVIQSDAKLENNGIRDLREAIKTMEGCGDYGSRDLLTIILRDSENHLDYLKTHLQQIKLQGLQNYISAHSAPK